MEEAGLEKSAGECLVADRDQEELVEVMGR